MKDASAPSSSVTPILLAIVAFSTLSIAAAVTSEGFLEGDACTHYLYARFAFEQPHFFVNIWGRPVCTGIYSVPALVGGRLGVQGMSLLLAIGCGVVAFRIAQNQGYRWPALALIFTLAQPLVFLHSFSELTELPFACLLGLGFLAFQTHRWLAFSVLIGLSPLSRPEGFGFILLGALALVFHRRWWLLPVLAIPLIGWSWLGWSAYGREGVWWRWLIDNWPYSPTSLYDSGPIWHFAQFLPVFTGPIVFPAMLIGAWRSFVPALPVGEGRGEGAGDDHAVLDDQSPRTPTLSQRERGRMDVLIAIVPLMILVGHSLLYYLGKLASNGELRYMLVVAPFWGLLSARGWEWIFTRMNWDGVYRWAGVAALVPALANSFYRVVPIRLDEDSLQARAIVQWYEASGVSRAFPRVATSHQMIYYFMGSIGTDPDRALEWHRQRMSSPTAGTIVVWHAIYSLYNSDERRIIPHQDLTDGGWIDVSDRVPSPGHNWKILLSPTDAQGRDARDTLNSLSSP